MSKIIKIGNCPRCPYSSRRLYANDLLYYCKQINKCIETGVYNIKNDIHPDCPLSDKEDFVKSLDIGDLCDGVIYHLKNDKEKSDG